MWSSSAAYIAVGLLGICHGTAGFVFAPTIHGNGVGGSRSFAMRPSSPSICNMVADGEFDVKANEKGAEDKMKKSIESVKQNLQTLRTGRASPSILDRVMVECYGTETPLNQVASVKTSSATQLVVDAYDKGILANVADAILQSNVGLTPNNDGSVIRLNMPPVTEDRRKELGKEAKGIGEDGKVAVRNIRRDAVDSVKKAEKSKALGKDQAKDATDSIQKLTDKYSKMLDEVVSTKEKEIMTV
ncbi:unnamed protein product [Discosporangium mesarthrocarpum]